MPVYNWSSFDRWLTGATYRKNECSVTRLKSNSFIASNPCREFQMENYFVICIQKLRGHAPQEICTFTNWPRNKMGNAKKKQYWKATTSEPNHINGMLVGGHFWASTKLCVSMPVRSTLCFLHPILFWFSVVIYPAMSNNDPDCGATACAISSRQNWSDSSPNPAIIFCSCLFFSYSCLFLCCCFLRVRVFVPVCFR